MPQKASPSAVLERRYRDLVRLAYLILPGKGRRLYRLALAQRIVDCEFPLVSIRPARPGSGRHGYARMRARVVRRAMNPSWRLRIGLGPWLRGLPTRLPDPALTLALAELDPPVRVAYVLRQVERMPRYAVRDLLVELGVQDVQAVLEASESIQGLPKSSGNPAEVVVDVSARRARERAVRRRSRVPVAVATALTIALVGTVFVLETGSSSGPAAAPRHGRLIMAAPRASWENAPRTFDVWPARGELVGDRAFTGRALAAWVRRAGADGDPQLLYAGRVGRTPTALLRHRDRIVRYTEPDGALRDLPVAGRVPPGPLALGGGHYLLPPWTTHVQTPDGEPLPARRGPVRKTQAKDRSGQGTANGTARDEARNKETAGEDGTDENAASGKTAGRSASVRPASARAASAEGAPTQGMENPVVGPLTARTPCRRGPLMSLRDHHGSAMLADLGGPVLTTVRHRSATDAAPRPVMPRSAAVGLWRRLSCGLPASAPARPVVESTSWEFWTGRLPGQDRPARWVCTRHAYAGGGTSTHATLLEPGGRRHDAGSCGDPRRPVSGLWWRGPDKRWYYLAAAAPGAVPHAAGPVKTAFRRGRLLVATGPEAGRRPAGRVIVTARTP